MRTKNRLCCAFITVTHMNLYITIAVTGTICTIYTTIVRTSNISPTVIMLYQILCLCI